MQTENTVETIDAIPPSGQREIAKDSWDFLRGEDCVSVFARGGFENHVPGVTEHGSDQRADNVRVVHHEDWPVLLNRNVHRPYSPASVPSRTAGKKILNAVPFPGSLCT